MPLYEYECPHCHHRFEKIQKFSDPPHTTCPKCAQEGVQQVISAPAVQFKGSGWYVTDYARKSGSKGAPDGKSADSKSGDSKPEAKPEAKPDTSSKTTAGEK